MNYKKPYSIFKQNYLLLKLNKKYLLMMEYCKNKKNETFWAYWENQVDNYQWLMRKFQNWYKLINYMIYWQILVNLIFFSCLVLNKKQKALRWLNKINQQCFN